MRSMERHPRVFLSVHAVHGRARFGAVNCQPRPPARFRSPAVMSLALARKYRPKRFADVAVQSHVASTLKSAIARGRVAHGYLLCGPRGVGKTTLARVLAMALNCERRLEKARQLQELEQGRGAGASAA